MSTRKDGDSDALQLETSRRRASHFGLFWAKSVLRMHRNCYFQWLKCDGTQGKAVPHFQFMAQSVPPPQLVTMLGKCTRPLLGAQT